MATERCHIPILSRLALTHRTDASDIEAIANHVQRLLNTRRGEALSCPEYGLIDLVDLLAELPQSSEHIGRSIALCIKQFEPRLLVHAVTLTRDVEAHTLHFAIDASVVRPRRSAALASPLQLQAKLDASGRIEVAL